MMLLKQGLGDEILARLPDCKDGKWWKTFKGGAIAAPAATPDKRATRLLSVVDEDSECVSSVRTPVKAESNASSAVSEASTTGALVSPKRRFPRPRGSSLSEDDTSVVGDDDWSEDQSFRGTFATESNGTSTCDTDDLSDAGVEELGQGHKPLAEDEASAVASPRWTQQKDATTGATSGEAHYLEGYLKKQFLARGIKSAFSWHRRWFVLSGTRLFHFRDRHSTQQKKGGGGIPTEQLTRLELDPRKKQLIMEVPDNGARKDVRLMGETVEETTKWMRAIAAAHQRGGGTLPFDFVTPIDNGVEPDTIVNDYDGLNEEKRLRQVDTIVTSAMRDAATLPEVTRAADSLVLSLIDICACAGRRLPPREDVARFVIREWNQRIFDILSPYLQPDQLGRRKNESLLVPWVTWYEEQLRGVQVGRLFIESCVKKSSSLSHLEGFKTLQAGWAEKDGMVILEKHRRRMVLRNGIIFIYKTRDSTTVKSICRVTSVSELVQSKGKFVVVIDASGTRNKFKGESDFDSEEWLAMLQQVCKRPVDDPDDTPPPKPAAPHGTAETEIAPAPENFDTMSREAREDKLQERVVAVFTQGGQALTDPDEVVEALEVWVDELVDIVEKLRELSPPRDDMVDFYANAYTSRVFDVLRNFLQDGPKSDEWLPAHTLRVVTWVEKYKQILEVAGLAQPDGRNVEDIMALQECILEYIATTSEELRTRLDSIIAMDMASEPFPGQDGMLQTHAPFDMFSLLNAQLDVVVATASQQMILQTIKNCLPMLLHFQQSLLANFEGNTVELDHACAVGNNSQVSLEALDELEERLSRVLNAELVQQVDVESVQTGFDEVTATSLQAIVRCVFDDLRPLVATIFEKRWYDEPVMDEVVAMLGDVHKALATNLSGRLFRKTARDIFSRLIVLYLERMLLAKKAKKPDDQLGERLNADITKLADFFFAQLPEHGVKRQLKVLKEVGELVVCNPGMISCYWGTLCAETDATPAVLDRLMAMRVDLDKQQKAEVPSQLDASPPTRVVPQVTKLTTEPPAENGAAKEPKDKLALFQNLQLDGTFPLHALHGSGGPPRLERRGSLFAMNRLRSGTSSPSPEPGSGGGLLRRVRSMRMSSADLEDSRSRAGSAASTGGSDVE
eukprot:CAMPEP_0175964348 /NCGR_PEP_ID=MMETSP0108-20121206/37507_1 /TAXON_ID=195067 ORGANISM="Goniomonas pacifica, Strain CCMP1869" /NCGR_SAMPLE_ID=MMETSP0108 /ASSEMBLY_ACC=CAM_ASM_000204 /LENGTH=1131 /DNA_ID=CAMNT_0017292311 /DNA_START=117 /DNA_END=3512 /DNA_ORIENTATION=+